MSSESRTVILAVGLIAGWLAGQIVHGTGYGIINDLIIGVVGSFIGGWLLPQLGIHLGAGIIAAVINATIGAVLLLLILRLVRGGGRWDGGWVDDGAGIASAIIAVCDWTRAAAHSRDAVRATRQQQAGRKWGGCVAAGLVSWLLDELSRRETAWSNRSGARLRGTHRSPILQLVHV
jgi:uncharacterized membrane protein YeaQ/YmgE (transglycosylase-associated protein family)